MSLLLHFDIIYCVTKQGQQAISRSTRTATTKTRTHELLSLLCGANFPPDHDPFDSKRHTNNFPTLIDLVVGQYRRCLVLPA